MHPSRAKEIVEKAIDHMEEQLLVAKLDQSANRTMWERQEKEGGKSDHNPFAFTHKDREEAKMARRASRLKIWNMERAVENIAADFADVLAYVEPEPEAESDAEPDPPPEG